MFRGERKLFFKPYGKAYLVRVKIYFQLVLKSVYFDIQLQKTKLQKFNSKK